MDPRRDRGRPDLGSQMSQETPALSVVIPVYNEGENVVPTLRGVVEHTRTRPLEVLVVHDFDEDTTVPVVRRLQAEFPQVRLHKNTLGRGVLNAMKSGLRAARRAPCPATGRGSACWPRRRREETWRARRRRPVSACGSGRSRGTSYRLITNLPAIPRQYQ